MNNILLWLVLIMSIFIMEPRSYIVEGINSPQQVVWINPFSVEFVKDGDVFELNILTKSKKYIRTIAPNVFVGTKNEKNLQFCTIEHYMITSRDQFSTIFKIEGRELKFFETIRPIYWKDNTMVAQTAIDFLEQHYYEIDTRSGNMKEIPHPPVLRNPSIYIEKDNIGNLHINYNLKEYLRSFF